MSLTSGAGTGAAQAIKRKCSDMPILPSDAKLLAFLVYRDPYRRQRRLQRCAAHLHNPTLSWAHPAQLREGTLVQRRANMGSGRSPDSYGDGLKAGSSWRRRRCRCGTAYCGQPSASIWSSTGRQGAAPRRVRSL